MYTVKEIFPTLQGEGAQVGRAAVFLRFSGCNLWTGQKRDQPKAFCRFCDTDFVGYDGPEGGKFECADSLADVVARVWHEAVESSTCRPHVVCTGGEPTLQLDAPLIDALHARGFTVALETNGTRPAPQDLDWICVSPKAGVPLAQREGNELKLVYPQIGAQPQLFERLKFQHFFLQPLDGPNHRENLEAAARYCLRHPPWRLSLQTHKLIGIR
jgi:7-carboxy-7-deazaguanine synthase